jgi:hypothetical protein
MLPSPVREDLFTFACFAQRLVYPGKTGRSSPAAATLLQQAAAYLCSRRANQAKTWEDRGSSHPGQEEGSGLPVAEPGKRFHFPLRVACRF